MNYETDLDYYDDPSSRMKLLQVAEYQYSNTFVEYISEHVLELLETSELDLELQNNCVKLTTTR